MKSTTMIGVCAGLALVAGMASSALAAPSAKQVQKFNGRLTKIDPIAVRGIRMVGNQIVPTTPWIKYQGAQGARGAMEYVFDAYETESGMPGEAPGGDECGTPSGGGRWFGGTAYILPSWVNDMTVAPGTEGSEAPLIDLAWYQGVSETLFMNIFTAEDFNGTCAAAPPFTNAYDGVQLNFGTPGVGGFFSNVDLTAAGLFMQMPMDGSGAYLGQYRRDAAGMTRSTRSQPFLWGTGEDEVPADPRAGTQDIRQWDDDLTCNPTCGTTNVPDGMFTAPAECYDYSFGLCPDPLGAMMGFAGAGGDEAPVVTIISPTEGATFASGASILFEGMAIDEDGDLSALLNWSSSINGAFGSGDSFTFNGLSDGTHVITASVADSGGLVGSDTVTITVGAATCPVDLNGDGSVTIADFLEFLNLFAAGNPRAEFDGNPGITVGDFLAFLNAFAVGC